MKKPALYITSLFLTIAVAVGAYFWAMGIFSSNFAYRSPLKDNPPSPGEAIGQPVSKRVIIVLVDSLRYDTSLKEQIMPELNHLRARGASARMQSMPPSYSEPGYTTLLTGAWPELNDGPTFNLEYDAIPTWTQDNLFSAAHRAGLKTAIAGYYWFEKLVPQQDVDLHFYTSGEDRLADEQVLSAALPWLKTGNASLVLIHLDQVDYAGHHEGGPNSPAWDEAAARVDSMIGLMAGELDFSQDTLVVVSDHGQIDAGGHGGTETEVLTEPFVMAGAGVIPGEYRNIQMVDLAPTISALLGLNLPASTQGEVLTFMLSLPGSVTSALPQIVEEQQTRLLKSYASSLGMRLDAGSLPTGSDVAQYQSELNHRRESRILGERIVRAAILAILLAFAVFLFLRNVQNGSFWWLSSGLVFVALFNYRYAFWDQKTYSVSSIADQNEWLLYVAVTAGIAFLIAWLITALGKRTFWQKPWDASLSTIGFTLTTVLIAGLPVLWNFYMNGVLVTWTLPDYPSSYLGLLALLQIILIACGGVLASLLTLLITWSTQRKGSRQTI